MLASTVTSRGTSQRPAGCVHRLFTATNQEIGVFGPGHPCGLVTAGSSSATSSSIYGVTVVSVGIEESKFPIS